MSARRGPAVDQLNALGAAAALSGEGQATRLEEIDSTVRRTRPKRKPAVGSVTKDLRAMGLENFEMLKVHRRDLIGAAYNPRILGDNEKRKLKAGIARHGMVSPITWNARTGHIVGGHQRLAQLDDLAGTADYEMTVAKIDVEEPREKEINILLNNASAMGEWDLEALGNLVKDPAIVLAGTGFDHADLFQLFGDSPLLARNEKLDELADKVRDARDRYDAIEANNGNTNAVDFYCVVVFRDGGQLGNFLAALKLPDNRYQSGEQLATLLGVFDKLTQAPA
jgi:hypothetical protein